MWATLGLDTWKTIFIGFHHNYYLSPVAPLSQGAFQEFFGVSI